MGVRSDQLGVQTAVGPGPGTIDIYIAPIGKTPLIKDIAICIGAAGGGTATVTVVKPGGVRVALLRCVGALLVETLATRVGFVVLEPGDVLRFETTLIGAQSASCVVSGAELQGEVV